MISFTKKVAAVALVLMASTVPLGAQALDARTTVEQKAIANDLSIAQSKTQALLNSYVSSGQMSPQAAAGFTAELNQSAAISTTGGTTPQYQQSINKIMDLNTRIQKSLSAAGTFTKGSPASGNQRLDQYNNMRNNAELLNAEKRIERQARSDQKMDYIKAQQALKQQNEEAERKAGLARRDKMIEEAKARRAASAGTSTIAPTTPPVSTAPVTTGPVTTVPVVKPPATPSTPVTTVPVVTPPSSSPAPVKTTPSVPVSTPPVTSAPPTSTTAPTGTPPTGDRPSGGGHGGGNWQGQGGQSGGSGSWQGQGGHGGEHRDRSSEAK